LKIPYTYSITRSKQEFQLATTLENNGKPIAFVDGNYSTVSKYILPSIIIAYNGNGSININTDPFRNLFILDGVQNNLPYNFEDGKAQSNT
jgi:hypothetical protein